MMSRKERVPTGRVVDLYASWSRRLSRVPSDADVILMLVVATI
jgi:hypothetical protein